jgi:hypothetical protein
MREHLRQTPSQTAGPYVHIGCAPAHAGLDGPFPDLGTVMLSPQAKGERIIVTGCVIDGAGIVLKDALVEIIGVRPTRILRDSDAAPAMPIPGTSASRRSDRVRFPSTTGR